MTKKFQVLIIGILIVFLLYSLYDKIIQGLIEKSIRKYNSDLIVSHGVKKIQNQNENEAPKFPKEYTRDFQRFNCKNVKRIGGVDWFVRNAPDPLFRIDGAWYVCFDDFIKPINNNCLVYSFGIRNDESFDKDMNQNYGCKVYSFDPFYEHTVFTNIRNSNPKLINSHVLPVNDKWNFYRLGITGLNQTKDLKNLKKEDLLNFDQILDMTNNKNKIVDIFKMDIEGNEKTVLENIDVDYFCKYVKQFMLETHVKIKHTAFKMLQKMEKCFYLFKRDTRFFMGDTFGPTGLLTELQNPNGYLLQIKQFKDELDLANYMFSMGELYFVNLNFLE